MKLVYILPPLMVAGPVCAEGAKNRMESERRGVCVGWLGWAPTLRAAARAGAPSRPSPPHKHTFRDGRGRGQAEQADGGSEEGTHG